MVDLSVNLCGKLLSNPVIPSSGTFGYGYGYSRFYDLDCLGSMAIKTTTPKERFGNPTPRIAEVDNGLLLSIGLQNPGVEKVLSRELVELKKHFHKPIIANISGFCEKDYLQCIEAMEGEDSIGWFEINISCPNVKGGLSIGSSVKEAENLTRQIKKRTDKPVLMKLSPNVTDITEIARACEAGGADGLSLINALLGMRIDLKTRRPVLAKKIGGYAGPAVKPVALRMVWQVYEAVKIPIVGIGGIRTAQDVLEYILAGATAVEIGSANLVDPLVCRKIIDALPGEMQRYGISSFDQIRGMAHEQQG